MLSYRHSFHAGNHADVLKHAALCLVLEYLKKKDRPFVYIDTHAGRGIYDLTSREAEKTGEFHEGIEKLLTSGVRCPALEPYLGCLEALNPAEPAKRGQDPSEGETVRILRRYPGSPALARLLLRPDDRMIFMELHSNEFPELRKAMEGGKDHRITFHHRDGFEGLNAVVPPAIRRGAVLIDPSYETTGDYQKALDAAGAVLRKWAGATVMVWYPHLSGEKDHTVFMLEKARKLNSPEKLVASLWIQAPQDPGDGMYGSSLLICNPTYGMKETLEEALAAVVPVLARTDGARYMVRRLED